MIVYHGSGLAVETPDLVHSRRAVDFGAGFYTTPILKQAVNWCEKRRQRRYPNPSDPSRRDILR